MLSGETDLLRSELPRPQRCPTGTHDLVGKMGRSEHLISVLKRRRRVEDGAIASSRVSPSADQRANSDLAIEIYCGNSQVS